MSKYDGRRRTWCSRGVLLVALDDAEATRHWQIVYSGAIVTQVAENVVTQCQSARPPEPAHGSGGLIVGQAFSLPRASARSRIESKKSRCGNALLGHAGFPSPTSSSLRDRSASVCHFPLAQQPPADREFPARLPSGKAFVCMDRLLDEERAGPVFLRIPAASQVVIASIGKGSGKRSLTITSSAAERSSSA